MKTYDALIVGGGIIGCSIAHELAQRSLRVAVLDHQELMSESSWAAAGMLSPAPESPAAIPLVPLGRASLALYPRFIEALEEASGRRTGFRTDGAIEVLSHGDPERELSTLVALYRGLGLLCDPIPVDEMRTTEPLLGRNAQAAALLPDECSVEPRAIASALLVAAASAGVTLSPIANVISLALEGKKCVGVVTSRGEILRAPHIVLAAGCWSSQIPEVAPYAQVLPVRGQMLALRHFGAPIRHVLRSERGYIVPRNLDSPQTLVVGSTLENAGYEKRVTAGGVEKILSMANELVPELSHAELMDTWSGLRPGTPDQLPILGEAGIEGLVFATGHYRSGILLAPITAKLVGEWITERRTSLDWEAFSPLRFLRQNADRTTVV